MNRYIPLLFCAFLTACASTDYAAIPQSSTELDNVNVTSDAGREALTVSFDYVIEDFSDQDGVYSCTVQFLTAEGSKSQLFGHSYRSCEISAQSGDVTFSWPTPRHKKWRVEKGDNYMSPSTFFIAVHQKINRNQNIVIGRSACIDLVSLTASTDESALRHAMCK